MLSLAIPYWHASSNEHEMPSPPNFSVFLSPAFLASQHSASQTQLATAQCMGNHTLGSVLQQLLGHVPYASFTLPNHFNACSNMSPLIFNFINLNRSSLFLSFWLKFCQYLWSFVMQKLTVGAEIHWFSKYQEFMVLSLRDHLLLPYQIHGKFWEKYWKDCDKWGWDETCELLSSWYDLAVKVIWYSLTVIIISGHVYPEAQDSDSTGMT